MDNIPKEPNVEMKTFKPQMSIKRMDSLQPKLPMEPMEPPLQ